MSSRRADLKNIACLLFRRKIFETFGLNVKFSKNHKISHILIGESGENGRIFQRNEPENKL